MKQGAVMARNVFFKGTACVYAQWLTVPAELNGNSFVQ